MDTHSTSTSYTQDVVDYDDDRSVDEVFRMYGIKAALDKSNSNVDDDCQSEGSADLEERLNSRLFVVRASASCGKILAQYPMDEAADIIAAHLVDRNRGSRTSCLVFRSMLQPIQKDKVPVRDELWLRKCMRGILLSAVTSECHSSLKHNLSPEYVYCWFMENGDDIDAWSYYYGLRRALASTKNNAEAWIHYHLLDDVNLDFSEFLLDVLSLVRSLKTQSWDNLLGIDSSECNIIWIPAELTKQVIDHMSVWSKTSIEELNRDISETLSKTSDEMDRVELYSFLQLLLNAHMNQIKKQTTLLRDMFETAATKDSHEVVSVDAEKLVTLTQLHEILKTIHEPIEITLGETSLLYRYAYEMLIEKAPNGNGNVPRGITYDSFLFAAKRTRLFSHIRREKNRAQSTAAIAMEVERLLRERANEF